MTLDNGDKAVCREIAREIVEEVLRIHIQSCPHGRSLLRIMSVGVGVAIGSGLAGGGVVIVMLKALGQL